MEPAAPVDLKPRFAAIERALALPVVKGFRDAVRDAVGPDFEKECPGVFAMLLDPLAHPRLRSMLAMAVSVDNGEVAEHDASVAVGTTLVNDFVKGKIPR